MVLAEGTNKTTGIVFKCVSYVKAYSPYAAMETVRHEDLRPFEAMNLRRIMALAQYLKEFDKSNSTLEGEF